MGKENNFNRDAILYEKSEGDVELRKDVIQKNASIITEPPSSTDQIIIKHSL